MSELEQQDVKSYPSLGQSWGLFGFTLLATVVIAVFAVGAYLVLTVIGKEGNATILVSSSLSKLVMYAAPFVVVIWLALRKKKSVEPGFQLKFRAPSPVTLLLIALATWSIYFLIDPIVDLIPMPKFFENLMLQLLSDHSLWSVLMLVVAAPICEELLFRGIILDGLLKRYSPTRAIIWSSVLFGLIHLNPWQFLAAFTLGAFMGWIYYRTGSVLVTMFIHFVANGTGVLLGRLFVPDATQMVTTREMVGSNALYFGLLAADVALLLLLLMELKKRLRASQSQDRMHPILQFILILL